LGGIGNKFRKAGGGWMVMGPNGLFGLGKNGPQGETLWEPGALFPKGKAFRPIQPGQQKGWENGFPAVSFWVLPGDTREGNSIRTNKRGPPGPWKGGPLFGFQKNRVSPLVGPEFYYAAGFPLFPERQGGASEFREFSKLHWDWAAK